MAKTKNRIKSDLSSTRAENIILEETHVEDTGEYNEQEKVSAHKYSQEKKLSDIKNTIKNIEEKINSDPVYSIIFGALLILISIFSLIAFVSFFFTWQEDFDKVTAPLSVLFSYETEVQNALGKVGALIAHIFIYRFYGIGSFVIPVALFICGLNKIRLQKTSANLLFHSLFWIIFLSLTLSFFFNETYPFAGGNYGEIINNFLIQLIGKWGLVSTLMVSIVVYFLINPQYIIWVKNISFKKKKENTPVDTNTQNITEEKQEEEQMKIEEYQETTEIKFEITPETEGKQENTDEPKFTIEQPSVEENQGDQQDISGDEIQSITDEEKTIDEIAQQLVAEQGEYNPLAELADYVYPSLDLLKDYGTGIGKINQEELLQNKDKIVKTLRNYGIEIQEIKATIGPTITLYEIVPAPGVRIARIKNLEDDIALSLAALGIRIIAPIPGKGTIGIEVPNQTPEIVSMKNVLSSEKFQNTNYDLPVILGKTISNEVYIADLTKMPHLLMAGATGQGKSVGINALLMSLLYKKHPAELKFVLIDPKKVELTLYNKIERHFLAKLPDSEESIITDTKKVIHTLNSLTIEMDTRYVLLQDAQVRNIKEYNQKFISRRLNPNDGHRYLPYIVVIIDEFADLIMTAGKEIETPISRIAQLARAVGIHLVIATQRPSVNIITGVIKANFPARVAFRVSSKIDSRTILDAGGAEQLVGRGDMLFNAGSDLIRLQCAFVDTPEIEKVTEFIGIQRGYPSAFLLPEYTDESEESKLESIDLSERDKLFEEAAKLVVQFQQGSASFLQRKMKIGFNRAGRLIDELEKAGIVGKFEGAKQREVLVKDFQQLEEILRKMPNG